MHCSVNMVVICDFCIHVTEIKFYVTCISLLENRARPVLWQYQRSLVAAE